MTLGYVSVTPSDTWIKAIWNFWHLAALGYEPEFLECSDESVCVGTCYLRAVKQEVTSGCFLVCRFFSYFTCTSLIQFTCAIGGKESCGARQGDGQYATILVADEWSQSCGVMNCTIWFFIEMRVWEWDLRARTRRKGRDFSQNTARRSRRVQPWRSESSNAIVAQQRCPGGPKFERIRAWILAWYYRVRSRCRTLQNLKIRCHCGTAVFDYWAHNIWLTPFPHSMS